MGVPNGRTDINGRGDDTELTHHSGLDDVVIKIRGRTAAKFLGRGEVEKQVLAALADLGKRLETMEMAANQHEKLSKEAVDNLQLKVDQLGGRLADQVGELRADLNRLRNDFGGHVASAGQMSGQVERAQMQLAYLQRQAAQHDALQGKVMALESQLGSAISNIGVDVVNLQSQIVGAGNKLAEVDQKLSTTDAKVDTLEKKVEDLRWWAKLAIKWRHAEKPPADGEAPANTSWLKQRLNFW
jgi:chromosome segregation ATPase